MKHKLSSRIPASGNISSFRFQEGFSIVEMMVALLIFLPLMIGATQLFEVGVKQHAQEQSTLEANMDATAGFDMMLTEIAQAGSHSDVETTINNGAGITGLAAEQAVTVASTTGFNVGDYVDVVDASGIAKVVKITAVGETTISGIFLGDFADGDDIRLFAQPYRDGVLPPTTLAANTSTNVTTLKFYGDINGDGGLYYVEYSYDSTNAQITRSITGSNDATKGAAMPLITNIKPGSAQFTLHTDDQALITAVTVSLTVQNKWLDDASKLEEIRLSSKVNIPSTQAASLLYYESLRYGGVANLPSTPPFIAAFQETGAYDYAN
ncbi:MAG: hypothetical protein P8Z37_11460 [Acidobacteriota bacterium]|jgi:hypothetical protein